MVDFACHEVERIGRGDLSHKWRWALNPIQSLLNRCSRGFTLPQKLLISVLVFIYILSPIDVLPDFIPVLGWGDDLYALYLAIRVWSSPTLNSDAPQLVA